MASVVANRICLDLPVFTQDGHSSRSISVLLRAAFNPPRREWRSTLRDVSFELRDGDRLAIIGQNGAGKSTLLKVLVGAYPITSGNLTVDGSRHALLNLSLGFDGEATLVENIMLRGVSMGLKPHEVAPQISSILDFAGLADRAGDRLRTLSSGQRMRLGFSLATAVEHDILLMDEWIGTGDARFVERAKARLKEQVDKARILVLASHNLSLLAGVCTLGIYLENGEVKEFGPVREVVRAYDKDMRKMTK